jgi:signal transduction histidine kinase
MTVTQRISFAVSLVLTAIILVTGAVTTFVLYRVSEDGTHRMLIAKTETVVRDHIVVGGGDVRYRRGANGETVSSRLRDLDLSARVVTASGAAIGVYGIYRTTDPGNANTARISGVIRSGKPAADTFAVGDGRTYDTYTVPLVDRNTVIGALQTATETQSVNTLLAQTIRVLFAIVPLSIILGWIAVYVSVRNSLFPLTSLVSSMAGVTAETIDTPPPIPDTNVTELRILAETFRTMLERIREGFRKQQEFTHNASHELKTPLTHAVNSLDLASMSIADGHPDEAGKRITKAKTDQLGLSDTVTDLLALAAVDHRMEPVSPVNAAETVSQTVSRFGRELTDKHIRVRVTCPDDLLIAFPKRRFGMIMTNLIENAVKYNRPNGTITVIFSITDHTAALTVTDTGIGMDNAVRMRAGARFFRGRTATDGTGLGLAIVGEIAHRHGLTVSIRSRPNEGTEITVTGFPIAPSGTDRSRLL